MLCVDLMKLPLKLIELIRFWWCIVHIFLSYNLRIIFILYKVQSGFVWVSMYHGRLFYWNDLLFVAVGTYIPRKEVVMDETIRATIIKPNQAIKLRARKETLVSVISISTF